ncbi:MAG: hypothetical protein KBF33_11875 [Comamonas sp.]|nr:hypothetical protein [Comamonas sp.]
MGVISASVALAAAANTTAYGPVAAGKSATVNINVCNRSTSSAKVRMAISTTIVPTAKEFIEYDIPVVAGGAPLLRTGEVLKAGEYVVIYTDGDSCSARVSGYDEAE